MMQPSKRGFAAMDPERQRQIARRGGQSAHARGTAHKFTPEEAREAGRKGGQATHSRREQTPLPAQEESSLPPPPFQP